MVGREYADRREEEVKNAGQKVVNTCWVITKKVRKLKMGKLSIRQDWWQGDLRRD